MNREKVVNGTQTLVLKEVDNSRLSVTRTLVLPSQLGVRQLASSTEQTYAVSEDGSVLFCDRQASENRLLLTSLGLPCRIRMIACNATAVMLVSESGEVLVMGSDPENNGFLCGLSEAREPTIIPGLEAVKVSQVGLGQTHEDGNLYTWGSGANGQLGRINDFQQPPDLVESAKIFTGKTLLCGDQVTAVITSGGFLYLYGTVGGHSLGSGVTQSLRRLRNSFSRSLSAYSTNSKPITLPGLQNKFVVSAMVGRNVLAVLTDAGEVYFFDDCLDLVRLPTQSKSKITAIGASPQGIYGLAANDHLFYIWQELDVSPMAKNLLNTLSASGHCQLLAWAGRVYTMNRHYQSITLRPTSLETAVSAELQSDEIRPFASLLCELSPYKRSQYIGNLMQCFYDSLEKWKSPQQRDGPTPFLSRASPIPFANQSGDESSSIFFDRDQKCDNVFALVETLERTMVSVAFRRVKSGLGQLPSLKEVLPNHVLRTCNQVLHSHLLTAFAALHSYAETAHFTRKLKEQELSFAKQIRDDGTKAMARAIGNVIVQHLRLSAATLFTEHQKRKDFEKTKRTVLLALRQKMMRVGKDCLLQSFYIWKTDIVKAYIKADGLKRLSSILTKRVLLNALGKTATFGRLKQLQIGLLGSLLSRHRSQTLKVAFTRCFSRWKESAVRRTLSNRRRLGVMTSGVRALVSRLKLFLRKSLFRDVIQRLKTAETRKNHLWKMKYPLAFFEMKVGKAKRRVCNFAFNQIYRTKKDPKWKAYEAALKGLEAICIHHTSRAFSLISHDTDSFYIHLVSVLVPFVTLLQRKMRQSSKSAWEKMMENKEFLCWKSSGCRDLEQEILPNFEVSPRAQIPIETHESFPYGEGSMSKDFESMFGRTPSPQKASLRIPSMSTYSGSTLLSPRDNNSVIGPKMRRQYHRATYSYKMLSGLRDPVTPSVKDARKLWNKPPWKGPSIGASFQTAIQPFSPRSRRADYALQLKERLNKQRTGHSVKAGQGSRSVGQSRNQSPELQLPSQSSNSGTPTSTPWRAGYYLEPRSRLSPSGVEDSGFSSVYAASTLASPRDVSVRQNPTDSSQVSVNGLIRTCNNLLFSSYFRTFVTIKDFPGHPTHKETTFNQALEKTEIVEMNEADLEVNWHKQLYVIGAERLRRLMRGLMGKRLQLALSLIES